MKSLTLSITAALVTLTFSSCSTSSIPDKDGVAGGSYSKFRSRSDYRTTMNVYKDKSVYDSAVPGKNRIRIDLSDQRAQLLVGPDRKVAIDTPVCTGKSGKRTPVGVYPVQEKIPDKRSNIFGSTYYRGKKVHGGDHRKYSGRRDKYIGAPLPYWMRMTGGGIGMHGSSYVHRNPRSNGCVRTPHHIIDDMYRKMTPGSKIQVVR